MPTLIGDSGNNTLQGGSGSDALYGRAGNDLLQGAQGDDLLYGEDGDDRLEGGFGQDYLYGGNGNDTLIDGGDYSRDFMYGGAGSDTITISGGADQVVLQAFSDSTASAYDIVNGFTSGEDTLNLSALDANTATGGDDIFAFLGQSSAFTGVGQVRYAYSGGNTFVYGNADTNLSTAEFVIQLSGIVSLSASDIVL